MKHTKERNVPVWTTIATYKHGKPAPYNDEETFWTTNISLAYGVKGVQYYIYWPQMEGYDSGDYLNNPYLRGMVDSSGMPLDAYYRVQKMNRQIKAVDQALMPSMPKGILQFGNLKIDIPKEDQLSEFGELKTVTGGDSFVGCFDNNGKSVYYVVNNNLGDWSGSKILGNSIFKMDFKKKVNVRFTNVDSGEKTINNAYSICFNLKPGEAMLVEVL